MHPSKIVTWIIVGIAGLVVVLLAFRTGVTVGYRQAQYSEEWQRFHGPVGGMQNMWRDFNNPRAFLNDHGTVGAITEINPISSATTSLTIADPHDGADKVVVVALNAPVIGAMATTSTVVALRVGQTIAVIGMPNTQGEIVASFIRVLPK